MPRLKFLWSLSLLAIIAAAPSVFAVETPAPASAAPMSVAEQPKTPKAFLNIDVELAKVRTLKEKGQYQEASRIYEKLLVSNKLSKAQRKKLRDEYEKLNEKLLFSRTLTVESKLHTVTEGESLYTIAKKNGTTSALIRRINGLDKEIIYPGMKLKIVTGHFFIRVDKSQNTLRLFLNDKPVKTYRVATGKDNSTPTGEFTIITKLRDPVWYKPGAVIEPGTPANHLGTRWLGFDQPGYGLHGTTEPKLIGQQVSHGCVRMRNEDVEELYDIVPQGTKAAVTD